MCQWIFILLFAGCVPAFAQSQPQTKPVRSASIPEPVGDASWMRRVATQQGLLTNQPCRVCFIGDSLTEFWQSTGAAIWTAEIAPLKALNLGLAADRTEHILHRIQRLDFRRANPQLLVLLMGTNNLAMEPPDSPEEVVRGISAAVQMLRTKLPQASILLLTLPPNGDDPATPLRKRIQQTNTLLAQAPWPERVKLLPIHDIMVDAQGRWHPGYTLDGTHFSESAYAAFAQRLTPILNETLREKKQK